ncbi:MAG: RNA methyltransferase [Terrimonas sp.]|nr:RNA methyltransferase [Terrimonas sp.]
MLSKTQIKYIQSLGQKKFRDAHQVFIAEGPKIAKEILTNTALHIRHIYALQNWITEHASYLQDMEVTPVETYELEKISLLSAPNQVLMIVAQPVPAVIEPTEDTVILALETIQDPGNLGTIIRIADWFGIKHIMASTDSADCYNHKVVQATMGSIGRVAVAYGELGDFLRKHHAEKIYACTLDGTDIRQMEKISRGILLVGNESKGISDSLSALAHDRVTIPRRGQAESLNAAVATGIILSHLT